MKIPTPGHFLTLGCEPFWALSQEDHSKLKSHVMKLSRQFHPDLLSLDASDEEREIAESRSSAINAAYLKLREQNSRCDYITSEVETHNPEEFSLKSKVTLPLELSMTYFELQDSIEEGKLTDAIREEIRGFTELLNTTLSEQSLKLNKFLNRIQTKLELSDEVKATWELNIEDLKNIAEIRGLQKYLERILVDIRKYQ